MVASTQLGKASRPELVLIGGYAAIGAAPADCGESLGDLGHRHTGLESVLGVR
jgi:hypothetical protein